MIVFPRKLTFFFPRLVRPWRVGRVLGMEERRLDFWSSRPIVVVVMVGPATGECGFEGVLLRIGEGGLLEDG